MMGPALHNKPFCVKHVLLLLALVMMMPFLSNCAYHAPLSELKMYQEKRFSDGDTVRTRYAHAIATSSYSYLGNNRVLETRGGKTLFDPHGAFSMGMTSIFMRPDTTNFATSVSYGLFYVGFDMTFHLFRDKIDQMYFTVGFTSLPTFYQFILQRRLLDGNPLGLSLGMQVRQLDLAYSRSLEPCGGFCLPDRASYFAFGPRATFTLSGNINPQTRQRTMIYGNFSVNYAPAIDLYFPNFGVALIIH